MQLIKNNGVLLYLIIANENHPARVENSGYIQSWKFAMEIHGKLWEDGKK